MNAKIKLGLSLLIALAFVLPSGGILAEQDSEVVKAVENKTNDAIYIGGDLTSQAPGDVSVLGLDEPVLGGPTGNAVREGTYPITIDLYNEPGFGDAEVKAFVDIYQKEEGERITMYETSFEDNFDIYNNWIQIDEDCGMTGGQFDSWTVSDARSFDGDYSFKSTMYDVYKGNQDDYLRLQEGLDVSDQAAVEVNFKIWVDGDGVEDSLYGGALWKPYDYLDFEIGDSTGFQNPWAADLLFMNWNPDDGSIYQFLWGGYYFFDTTIGLYDFGGYKDYTPIAEDLGGGWWQVSYSVPVANLPSMGIDPTDFKIQFSWITDPQFQYEGAYVDDIEIISIENFEHKVFQSHSQGPFTVPEGTSEFTFPMEWTAEGGEGKDTCYDVRLWLEVLDADHTSLNDWPDYLDIMVCVTDWFDTEVDDLVIETSVGSTPVVPGDGVLEYGEDAHIIAQVHLDGTLPAEDIPVTATAKKLTWETVFESDVEGLNPFPETYGDVQVTDKDAYSGSKSLGFFNDEYFEYLPGSFSYALGPSIDMSDKTEVQWDHAWKGITDPDDLVIPCLLDNYHNYVLGGGFAGANGNGLGGYQPEWISPTEPQSKYVSTDLDALVDWYKAAGFLRDGNGNEIFDIGIGYYFSEDGDDNQTFPGATEAWSGVFIDDIKITAETIGETVWTQNLIIPGPVEPCETVEVQFEWEDVPECNYLICVESHPDGACGNLNNPSECAEMLVVQDLEMIHPKEVETIDYTGEQNGEWGICSSDTDNYIATNADNHHYPANANNILQLSIDGEPCIDTSGLTTMTLDFDTWFELEWGYDFVYVEVADCPADDYLDWTIVDVFNGASYFYTLDDDQWIKDYTIDLTPFIGGDLAVRFRLDSDSGVNWRGMMIDDFEIPELGFLDTGDTMDNWYQYPYSLGNFWENVAPGEWCGSFPTANVENALIWETEIEDAYEAYLFWETDYNFVSGSGLVQVSTDGGENWLNIAEYTGSSGGYISDTYDMTHLAGNSLLVRFLAQGEGDWCIKDVVITGKKDTTAPSTDIQLSGTKADGWYKTPVTAIITATDTGAGMGSIHYILDGVETVVEGTQATFTVSENGEHNIEFWGVDKTGNEELPHNTVPTFKIDAGSPPTVALTAPEPGLYLFGNKLLSLSKVLIIGAFTAEATASDAESGVYRVQFLLDGDVVSEDTEAPYSAYIAQKHMGAGTLEVVAEDFSGNTASDSLDITYYKFL